jgi:hypothetical protein
MAIDSNTYAYVSSQDIVVIVHQNLCENESHIAKLRECENERELCDSTHCEVESIKNASVRDTPQKNRKLECKSCEGIFSTNTLMSTSSVAFPNVHVYNENKEEMAAHGATILVERSEKVSIYSNQLYTVQNRNQDRENGKISEVQSMILAPSKSLKGNENNSDLSLQNKVVSNSDKAHDSNGIDHTQNICADLIDSCAEILQVDN